MNEVMRIENSDLLLRLFDNGCFGVAMKKVESEWHPDPWDGLPCRVALRFNEQERVLPVGGKGHSKWTRTDNGAQLRIGSSEIDSLEMSIQLSLQGSNLHISIDSIQLPANASLVNIEYPLRSFSLLTNIDQGYVAVTTGEGALIPSNSVKLGTCQFWAWEDIQHGPGAMQYDGNPAMPFYGAQRDGKGYVAIVETTDDFAFQYIINNQWINRYDGQGKQSPLPQIACAYPVWLSQKGELGYARTMRFEFAANMNYVEMAKRYRKEAIRKGDFVSLAEKQKARPQVAQLAGAPYIAYYAGYPHREPGYPGYEYSYKQLQQVIQDLANGMSMKRAFVHFWGAYTALPPSCLPFDTAPGPVEDLKQAVDLCKNNNFLFTLYNDISAQLEETERWYPELQWKLPNGQPRSGWRWSRTCSSQYVNLLSKDMPEVVNTLGVNACYVDCINAGRMTECYDSIHPLTRGQDREARSAFYEYVHSLGLIFGGEHTGWWNAAHLEYTNGVGNTAGTPFLLRAFPVPLAHLVFHDAVVLFCHAGDDYSRANGTAFEDKVLRDLLRGIPPMFFINLRNHENWRQKLLDSYNVMSDPAAAVFHDELIEHEWLTDDQMVQRTAFSSGVEIRTNFDEIAREGLPAKGYAISGMPDGSRSGCYTTKWQFQD